MAKESTRADSRRNRSLILKAAAAVLRENPQASIADVAEKAGVTRATVYRHYADRDALLREMTRDAAMHLVPAMLDEMRPMPWADAMRHLATSSLHLGRTYRPVIMSVAPHLEEAARLAVENEPIQAEIAARRAAGEIDPAVPDDWLALCVRSLCLAAIGRLADPTVDHDAVVDQLATTLAGLVTPRAGD